ncbi:MAG: hypothetical protein M1838_005805 [Thelocarpon superellum]|nr:MAG: hypothetical protein M1838_005805 [Thelocarpon superellum]
MPNMEQMNNAITNRSLRNIRTELEYLTDASVISPEQLSSILAQLPAQTALHAPLHSAVGTAASITTTAPTPQPAVNQFADASLNGKQQHNYFSSATSPAPAPPPPAYGAAPPLIVASALYAYSPTDAGDVALQPNDRVAVLEYVNEEWWKGRNERTGQEGIFPRAYVKTVEERGHPPVPSTNYGNMPLDVSESATTPGGTVKPSKFEGAGKKFGKKLGNAAIFGAGATIGSDIVGAIL